MVILFAGDFCPRYRVADLFEQDDFEAVFGEIRHIFKSADYSIVNFECPITAGSEVPIIKCGPCLQCTEKGIEAIKWLGVKCVTLANNHFLDYGEKGALNTLDNCKKHEIDVVGAGIDLQDASRVLYKTINGAKLAIINCCENEFSIATEDNAGSYPLHPIKQFYQIREAKELADSVIVIVHGGTEFYQLPTPRMQDTYRFFIDAGADAVINHHQHCYSGYEIYNECPIFYGLGNFCFDNKDKRDDTWNYGYMLSLVIEKGEKTKFDIIPYEQCNEAPIVKFIDKEPEIKKIEELNSIILNKALLKESFDTFVENNKNVYLLALEPYVGHWGGLRARKLIPSLLSKEYFLRLYGYLKCDAHFDRLLEILRREIYE